MIYFNKKSAYPKFKLIFSLFGILIFIAPQQILAQHSTITLSGKVTDASAELPYVNVILNDETGEFVDGTITDEDGIFKFEKIKPSKYVLEISYIGYEEVNKTLFVGSQSDFLDVGKIQLQETTESLDEVVIKKRIDEVQTSMDKKTFNIEKNVAQSGGSILQVMSGLPGITVSGEKLQLRGSDKIIVLIDGRQSAITGIGGAEGLDNIPASNIERIEIINNPSAKYDSSGSAGIINIITKKNTKNGLNGKAGISFGLGSLWERKENLPEVGPQFKRTPKVNPSIALNYKKEKINFYVQVDDFFTKMLSKNDFSTRINDDNSEVHQQLKRNRHTNYLNTKTGIDWFIDERNTLGFSGSFTKKNKKDRGEQVFFDNSLENLRRRWDMTEDDNKTLASASTSYQHQFKSPGELLKAEAEYSFVRRDKDYDFVNTLENSIGTDAFELLSDEHILTLNLDYEKPLKYGKLETGINMLYRYIPSDMEFIAGDNSVLDIDAGGWAKYKELTPAIYGSYNFETEKWEAELGLRMEYVKIDYDINPDHNTYESDGYHYLKPFPNMRLGYKINDNNQISAYFNRRVDRPKESELRIFPKYDDAEIIKVGNPTVKPQYTNSFEIGYKTNWKSGYGYVAAYHNIIEHTLTRISTISEDSNLIYDVFQNAGKSTNTGFEVIFNQELTAWYDLDLNANFYYNELHAFQVENRYPFPTTYYGEKKDVFAGNAKLNNKIHLGDEVEMQFTTLYLSPDLVPQGRNGHRFSLDFGVKKNIQGGDGELFVNATDLLNTMVDKKTIYGEGFSYTTRSYKESQVIRIGYNYKF